MLAPGQIIERYTVEAIIGQGGMAVVYRVRHNQLGSLHALKLLHLPKSQIHDRLLQEGRAQAVIRHLNVVAVTDIVEYDGSLALLMELVEGPSLEVFLENQRPSLEEAEEWFRAICMGVGVAHQRGLVHRDLKPANVLLAPVDASGRSLSRYIPKVTDFGIAKLLDSDEPLRTTRTHVALGTPHYMAPEQIRDAKRVDARADIFSLGCLLYELVCGVRPFDGPDVLAILNSVATGRFTPPRRHVPGLPDRIVHAIEGALRIDRENRLPDCEALLNVLTNGESTRLEEPRALMLKSQTSSVSITFDEVPKKEVISVELPSSYGEKSTVPKVQQRQVPKLDQELPWQRWMPLAGIGAWVLVATLVGVMFMQGWWSEPGIVVKPMEEPVMPVTQLAPAPQIDSEPLLSLEDEILGAGVQAVPPKLKVPNREQSLAVQQPSSLAEEDPPSLGLGLFQAQPPSGMVEVTGATEASLYVDGMRVPVGRVSPGNYILKVRVPGRTEVVDMPMEVRDGETIRVECAIRGRCSISR